jgi:hypothetical protein
MRARAIYSRGKRVRHWDRRLASLVANFPRVGNGGYVNGPGLCGEFMSLSEGHWARVNPFMRDGSVDDPCVGQLYHISGCVWM